jgi:hypothetical protein
MRLIHYSNIHYSNAPVIMDDRIARGQDEHGAMKPNGLWVSDEDEFGWRSWCIEENFRLDMLTVHEVTLSNTANILVLETPGLIREFTIDHGREQPRPSGRRGACWRGSGRRCGGSDLGHRSRSAVRRRNSIGANQNFPDRRPRSATVAP